ncbi:MAG: hypothetical protein JW925_06945 [Syntrophaceae bacterium]|nr:hypothetical protein [Syntrophaceae bacterium]
MKMISYILLMSCSLLLYACAINTDIIIDQDSENIVSADIINDEDMKRVEAIKMNSTGILRKAFDVEEHHRKLTLNETRKLLGILHDRFKQSGLSVSAFEDRVLKRMRRDLEIINAFNKKLEGAKDREKDDGYKLCKHNRLMEIISGSESIVKEYTEDMVKGILPEKFEKSLAKITTLERNNEDKIVSGSFTATRFKGAIITMLVALNGDSANVSKLDLPKERNRTWRDYSVVFHTIPLPKKIDQLSIHPNFESFTYYYKNAAGPPQGEMGFPHSGYFPDGHHARNPHKGISNPEDCSSWVLHRILNAKYSVTSYNITQFFRIKTGIRISNKNYDKTREYGWLNSVLTPVRAPKVQTVIKPGYVLCIRRPEADSVVIPGKNYGVSGHVAIALFATDTHIIALACTRDVPLMEGIGVQKISLEREKNSDIMILGHK